MLNALGNGIWLQPSICSDDVKNMMKDILLIWTSVKQLDAAKADRKEVDGLGAELNNKSQVQTHNVSCELCVANNGKSWLPPLAARY